MQIESCCNRTGGDPVEDDLLARFFAWCLSKAHADGVFDPVSDPGALKLTVTLDGNPVWEGPGGI